MVIFTDQIELIIPPKKGRRHVLRLIRELLAFEPKSTGTDLKMALDTVNQILKRKSIIFLVSDMLTATDNYSRELTVTNKRHDLIGIDLSDPLEMNIENVGLLALEDPETREVIWVDTGDKSWQQDYSNRIKSHEVQKTKVFQQANVDRIRIWTDRDYTVPLTGFFKDTPTG